MRKNLLLTFFCFLLVTTASRQQKLPTQSYRLIEGETTTQTKNYFLLTLLQEVKEVKTLLKADSELDKIRMDKVDHLSVSLSNCEDDVF